MSKYARLAEAIEEVVNCTEGSWQDRMELVKKACDESALGEFAAWLTEYAANGDI